MTLRINETTGAVNQTFVLDGETINLNFSANEVGVVGTPYLQFAATDININVANLFELYGNVVITRTAGYLSIGVLDGKVFLGAGPYKNSDGTLNSSAIGILLSNVDFAMRLTTSGTGAGKYAMAGFGSVGFVGLSGLTTVVDALAPRFGFAYNTTGADLDVTMTVSSTKALRLQFDNAGTPKGLTETTSVPSGVTTTHLLGRGLGGAPLFSGSLTIGYPGTFSLSGTIQVQPLPSGDLNIIIPTAALSIGNPAVDGFSLSGRAAFTISKLDGFRMQDFRISSATVFGQNMGTLLDAINNLTKRPLTAELSNPFANGVTDRAKLNQRGYIDVIFNDSNGVGLKPVSITDNNFEFRIFRAGVDVTSAIGLNPEAVRIGETNTYRYYFGGATATTGPTNLNAFSMDAEYMVVYQENSWEDNGTGGVANKNLKAVQKFVAFDPNPTSGSIGINGAGTNPTGQLNAPPAAKLASLVTGTAVNPLALNKQGYIDVTFYSRNGAAINASTINGGEITLSGSGVLDAQLSTSAPVLLYGNTYRYYVTDKNTANLTKLFGDGEVVVTYVAGSFSTVAVSGTPAATNIASSDTIILSAASSATRHSTSFVCAPSSTASHAPSAARHTRALRSLDAV
jgi:hypothetical protein